MGRQLIRRSLSQVGRHLGLALWLPFLPVLVLAVVGLFVLPVINIWAKGDAHALSPLALSFLPLLSAMVFTAAAAWAGAAWHRRVLLGPASRRALVVPLGRVWACAWRLGLGVIGTTWAARLGLWLLGLAFDAVRLPLSDGALYAVQVVAVLLIYVGAAWLGLRVALALPAQALGEPLTLPGAWSATAPARRSLLGVAAVLALLWAIPWLTPLFALLVGVGPLPLLPLVAVAALAWWLGALLVWSSLAVLFGDLRAAA